MINFYKIIKHLSFIFLCLIIIGKSSYAQGSGTIRGRVFEKETGEPLIGANVLIKNTSLGAATDIEGKYVIRGIPAGTHTLSVSYIGYSTVTMEITIVPNKTIEQDFYLEPKTITGETIIITAQAEGQLSAINQQLTSNTIANVVSKDRIKELPDVNAAESIGRLPGVSIERYGGEATKVSIRGLEPKYNTITVNGVRLPSTSSYDRSVDLSLISSNMLDGIVLKKANTPDMDADALGGTVDLRLKEAPEGLKISLTAQGGYNQLQNYYGNYNFNGTASNRFLQNKLGVIFNFNLDNYDRSADKFQGNYSQTGAGEDIIVKPQTITLRNENVRRGRTGASVLLDYKLPLGKISANAFYNNLHSKGLFRINDMNIEHNSHYYNLELREGNTSIFTGALGFQQDLGILNFDITLSRSSSLTDNPEDKVFGFVQENGAFNTTKVEPGMDPHLIPSLQLIDTLKTGFRNAFTYNTKLKENETALQMNVQLPFNIGKDIKGYLKVGGKFRWLNKNNDQEQYGRDNIQYGGVGLNSIVQPVLRYLSQKYPDDWDWLKDSALARSNAVFPISRFLTDEKPPHFLNGEYDLGFMVDQKLLKQFLEALQETSKQTPSNWLYYSMGSIGYDYDGIERYQAGYIMTEISYKNLITLIPGVRYEADYSKYHGQRFKEVEQAGTQLPPADFERLENVRDNKFWLPMVHLIVNPFSWLKIRLARTETLTRPDYMQYAPITTIDRFNGYIRANNAALKPAKSTNYDASIQIYQNYVGFLTFSGFYKKINDLIFQSGYQLQPGVAIPEGLNIPTSWLRDKDGKVVATPYMDTYLNNPYPAYYKGFEIEWQTHFWYLPSFLRGLIFNVNYSRIFSEVDKQRFVVNRVVEGKPPRVSIKYIVQDTIRTGRMPYQPSHIFNFTIGYDIKDFSARLSFLYQTDKLTYLANYPGLDQSTGTYYRWDLTLQQKLPWKIQVFVNLNNLNKRADRSYRGNVETNAAYTEYYGFTMDVGIRYNF